MKDALFFCAMIAICLVSTSGFQPRRRLGVTTLRFTMNEISPRRLRSHFSVTKSENIDGRSAPNLGMYNEPALGPNQEQKVKPQDLLRKYGPAYLVTSIVLAIISYALCYLMIAIGVDVTSLLEKVGVKSSVAAANTGTAAIAYAIHKAASPIRFPPTVALTPVVARWFGRKPEEKK
jgi:Protein of unknown function (DUF1279)